jgi:ribose transport system substrate-binding protein
MSWLLAKTCRTRIVVRSAAAVLMVGTVLAASTGPGTKLVPALASAPQSTTSSPALASCVSFAQAQVTKAEKPIQLVLPRQHVNMAKNKGKSVWYIAPAMSIPFIASIAGGVKAAATAAGMKPTVFDGRGNVNTFNDGVSEAVAHHAQGIILQGINPALVSGPLSRAVAAHIPIIDSLNGDPSQPLSHGVRAHVTVNYTLGGRLMADWVMADSQCNGQTAVFTSSIYTIYVNMIGGVRSEMKHCPSCSIATVENVAPTELATSLGTITSTVLRRHPDVKYLMPFYDGMVSFMTPAISEVSSSAKIISHDGVESNLATIRSGGAQAADVSNPPNPAMGWAEVDEIGRLMAGQRPATEHLPQQIFVKANLPANNANLFPGYRNYQGKYRRLWGVR